MADSLPIVSTRPVNILTVMGTLPTLQIWKTALTFSDEQVSYSELLKLRKL